MPQSIPKGLTAEHVLQSLADLDAGVEHPFGAPTGYELVHDGRPYPPKAVVGLAHRHLAGRVLGPEEFSGGEAPGQANYVLREPGFIVEKKDAAAGESVQEASERGLRWSRDEVDSIVADYFNMLKAELARVPYPGDINMLKPWVCTGTFFPATADLTPRMRSNTGGPTGP